MKTSGGRMEEIKKGYTRVSQIIGQWNQYSHIDPHVLANKCRIGTEVHEKITAEIEGIFLEIGEDGKGYVESWMEWKESHSSTLNYLETEKRFYCHDLKITGAVDAVVEIGDLLVIVDYKTSATANKKIWALQASFYHYLVNKEMQTDPYVWFVHLKKDGKKARNVEIHCTEDLWEVAKSAFHTYRYFND